jgi:hypothetical protein
MKLWFTALMVLVPVLSTNAAENLAGSWRFALDRDNVGIAERWFDRSLPDKVDLPGDLTERGIGDEITADTKWTGNDKSFLAAPQYAPYRVPGNVKIPFWLQPERRYVGAAWYQRDIEVPASWANQMIRLHLERPHTLTRVWVDDHDFGADESLSTPHEYDLGALAPGKHSLTILVDNLRHTDVGADSHSVSDQTQGNWNGIVGRIELQPLGATWIGDLRVYPNALEKSVRIAGMVAGKPAASVELTIKGAGSGNSEVISSTATPGSDGAFEVQISLGDDAHLWDEFNPDLYEITATPTDGTRKTSNFGLRELGHEGSQLTINGRKLFLRGTLDCAIFPKTGHPRTDIDSWKREYAAIQDHGLNHVRFHSWCPPEAAFAAADAMGLYLQVECASWANWSTTLGDGKPVDAYVYAEADRILKSYGNHPSLVLMAYGNEPGGKNRSAFLSKWVQHFKDADPRRLYTGGSGWPVIPENQVEIVPEPRIQRWKEGLDSRVNALAPATTADYIAFNAEHYHGTPVISHEIGQWCAYPNFAEMAKYTGYLKPKNFEIFQETLAAHHMADQAHDFLITSGKHQTLFYKEEIESALRTTNMSGFQLLGLQDFSGQGTALVGVLDAFWETKGYVTAPEFRRFCGSTVPLARLPKRVFTTDDTLTASLEVAHFGARPLPAAPIVWALRADDGHAIAKGSLPAVAIPVDNGTKLGEISIALRDVPAPARYKLVVTIADGHYENDWDVWIYPPKVETAVPAGITVTNALNQQATDVLAGGGTVLWLVPPQEVQNDPKAEIKYGFSPIFWNTAWTTRQAPTTLGILCDPKSPALAVFPTDSHSNWQWWYLVTKAQPMILDEMPAALRPIVQVIDDWFTNRKLGLVFEARVGTGKILVCSIDLEHAVDPVNAQMRRSLLEYIASDKFRPPVELTVDELRTIHSRATRGRSTK